jgi:RimJ/RimL family protein N-acetyltransferase
MLEGKKVNLRVVEKEDLSLVAGWRGDAKFQGEFNVLIQESKTELQKRYDSFGPEEKWFVIEKEDGAKIGLIVLELEGGMQEIGYGIIPNERRKGYCTEAVKIAVDYLFLSKPLIRIQAHTNVKNMASQRVLKKKQVSKKRESYENASS